MQRFCALIVWLIVGFAIVAGPGGVGPAHSEKQNKDQDKNNKKKNEYTTPLPGYYTRGGIRNFCDRYGGTYTHYNERVGGKFTTGNFNCQIGCGTGGCEYTVWCHTIGNTGKDKNLGACEETRRTRRPVFADPARAETGSSILDNGPPLSVNQPSRTGTPKAPPSLPPAPRPPPPNPG